MVVNCFATEYSNSKQNVPSKQTVMQSWNLKRLNYQELLPRTLLKVMLCWNANIVPEPKLCYLLKRISLNIIALTMNLGTKLLSLLRAVISQNLHQTTPYQGMILIRGFNLWTRVERLDQTTLLLNLSNTLVQPSWICCLFWCNVYGHFPANCRL